MASCGVILCKELITSCNSSLVSGTRSLARDPILSVRSTITFEALAMSSWESEEDIFLSVGRRSAARCVQGGMADVVLMVRAEETKIRRRY